MPVKSGELWFVEFEDGFRAVAVTLRRDRSRPQWVSWTCALAMLQSDDEERRPWYRRQLSAIHVLDWPDRHMKKLGDP